MTKTDDLMHLIGTSATVYPAEVLSHLAKLHDAMIIEINSEPTLLTGGNI